MSCVLHSKSDPRIPVGEVTVSVAFRTTASPAEDHWNERFGGSCIHLNVLSEEFEGSGEFRRRSNSFGRGLAETTTFKPVQYVTPVIQVTETDRREEDGDDWESTFKKLGSARGRINSVNDVRTTFLTNQVGNGDDGESGRKSDSENTNSDSDSDEEDEEDFGDLSKN